MSMPTWDENASLEGPDFFRSVVEYYMDVALSEEEMRKGISILKPVYGIGALPLVPGGLANRLKGFRKELGDYEVLQRQHDEYKTGVLQKEKYEETLKYFRELVIRQNAEGCVAVLHKWISQYCKEYVEKRYTGVIEMGPVLGWLIALGQSRGVK